MPQLASNAYCTGCTACASACPFNCISMEKDGYGFAHPVIDAAACTGCGLCEKACPILTHPECPDSLPQAFAAYSKDEAVRRDSSSGGIFTELAGLILEEGGVVFGAAYSPSFEIIHICVENKEDLAKLRGAKYAQSDMQGVFNQVKAHLKQGRKVLFSGTPCQVGGLKAYLKKLYDTLLTMDFVCHSVPSPMAWREYVAYRSRQENGGELPAGINLRSKETGWSHYRYSSLFEYRNGKRCLVRNADSLYMKLFVGGYINRESCENCKFKGYQRVSDLTVGDFWGIWDILPEMDDNRGISVVLVQSEKGRILWNSLRDRICSREVTPEQASRCNSAMLLPMKANANRETALKKIQNGKIGACEVFFSPGKQGALSGVKRKLKRLLIAVYKKVSGQAV